QPKDDKPKETKPLDPPIYIPEGFKPAAGSKLVGPEKGPKLHTRLEREGAAFVLLQPEDGLAPFYLMEDKATNALLKRLDAKGDWRKGGKKGADDAGDGDRLPALRLTRPEAEAIARRLGGKLPSAAQLDYAAGDLGTGRAAVGR